jgi:L-alanine-DL-glutamate epimerase-like enolase superfamily enzyme
MNESIDLARAVGLRLHAEVEHWPVVEPFRITGHIWEKLEVLLVRLECDGSVGTGEAAGVYYRQDTPASALKQIERVRSELERGISREALQTLLPAGAARNALDCALWDLEAKLSGRPAWQLAGREAPRPLLTTFTCGADAPEKMAQKACGYAQARAIKLKLTGDEADVDRVLAVREARPDVWLGVDANQGFTPSSLERLLSTLLQARVEIVEQPFPVGKDRDLESMDIPIRVAVDESVQVTADIDAVADLYDVVNIKLDKAGGLTEALQQVTRARELGLSAMVGNMMGTSLAMAPAMLVGQMCEIVDLDGPVFLTRDRSEDARYENGCICVPEALWGSGVY